MTQAHLLVINLGVYLMIAAGWSDPQGVCLELKKVNQLLVVLGSLVSLWSPTALADIWPDGPKGQSKAMDAYAAGYLGYACTCSWWCKDLGGVVCPPRPRPHFVRGKFTLALACPFAPIYSASACLSCCCSLGAATMLHALLSPFQFFFCISSSSSILALPYPI
jgi:hypothetical protein